MSKLNIDQKNVLELFGNKKTNFLIPDYQRPYAWGENECQTLWEDLFAFSFPNNNYEEFDGENHEYFLGPIVTFKNDDGKMEIIDGQQRLTTLMLLLRAFYDRFKEAQDENAITTRKNIEKCIWKTDEFGNADKSKLKIYSEVASDDDKDEFLNILRTGIVTNNEKSRYAKNFRFFQVKIEEFINEYLSLMPFFPTRIMNNCILLPIEAETQDTALQIFSTLNDRGKPLSDADIFKAQFYKYYSNKGEKDIFIKRWNELSEMCDDIFPSSSGSPLDEIFTRYMYYERAKKRIKTSTTEGLRKFYEQDGYSLLKKDETFENLIDLAKFWNDVDNQEESRFTENVLKRLYVLNYAPNGMWTYFVSVYYMANRENFDNEEFDKFLNKITAFIWAYALTNPGVGVLRAPVYAEMVNVVYHQPVKFAEYLFDAKNVRNSFDNYEFRNQRPITKSMLTWWAFQDPEQPLLELESKIEIEHIYAKKRHENEPLTDPNNLESLGNKSILEKKVNIRAAEYRLNDKANFYLGNEKKEGTKIKELRDLAKKVKDSEETDFTETNINIRYAKIISDFIEYMNSNNLIRKELNSI